MVRGAGLSVDRLTALACPAAARAADAVLEEEEALVPLRDAVRAAVEATYPNQSWPTRAKALVRRVSKGFAAPGRADGDPPDPDVIASALRALSDGEARLETVRASFERCFVDAKTDEDLALRAVAEDPTFREAIAWQNPAALTTGIDALLRNGNRATMNREYRKKQELVWRYAQRYCAKNDTIGFFGPVGWGSLGEGELELDPGEALVSVRDTRFEPWVIHELAAMLARQPELRPHLVPRRSSSLRLEGCLLHFPVDRTTELPEAFARLVDACDGIKSAGAIARTLLEDRSLELESEADVFELLDQLVAKKLVTWTLEVPAHTLYPERELRAWLERIEDEALRRACLAPLDAIMEKRHGVARAVGSAERLRDAVAALGASFSEITGAAANRRPGELYAGRTVVYEDCLRDLRCELSLEIRNRLAAPLELLLTSARWYCHRIGAAYLERCNDVYATLSESSPDVDFIRFVTTALPDVGRGLPEFVAAIQRELQRRWATILGLEGEQRVVERTSAELGDAVAKEFAAPGAAWPLARFHAPDILVAAQHAEAVRRGDFQIVIGEIHVAATTLLAPIALSVRGDVSDLWAARAVDLPRQIREVHLPTVDTRGLFWSPLSSDLELEIGTVGSALPPEQVLRPGELFVRRDEKTRALEVWSRRDGRRFPLFAVIDGSLSAMATGSFHFLPQGRHVPRVLVDGVVFGRESWAFASSDLTFDAEQRFLGGRRWARRHGIPRFVFYRVPTEKKPLYLDLESPIAVENFLRMVKSAGSVKVSEMLPTPEQCWLPDAQGRRYASEFRFVAVDPNASPDVF
jgi:hypothetical protein